MKATYTQALIPDVIQDYLMPFCRAGNVITLQGALGAGKTTLVRELLRELGITEAITSPTYSYVNAYTTPDGLPIYHFDLYRLGEYSEFIEAGFDEYINDEEALCIIEWPEILLERDELADRFIQIKLSPTANGNARIIEID